LGNEDDFRILLNLNQGKFEVEGSKSFVEKWTSKLENKIEDKNYSSQEANESSNSEESSSEKQRSIGEVYDPKEFSKKQNRALFIGWSLEILRDNEEFTKKQIKDVAQEFKIELGANLTRDVQSLIKKGKLKRVGEDNGEPTYYLTRTGEQIIEEKVE
jgi:hypothetical protein